MSLVMTKKAGVWQIAVFHNMETGLKPISPGPSALILPEDFGKSDGGAFSSAANRF